jgi:diadenosine tetraphosphate (Ap4A) HIT family hydrolase
MKCHTCELVERRDRGEAPPWDCIARAPHWDVGHAFDTSIEGWLVLVLRRHATSVADLLDSEAASLGPLIAATSRALERVLRCTRVYVAQFAEHPLHPHVHFHLIARPPNLAAGEVGPGIFTRLGVAPEQRVSDTRMNEIAAAVRRHLDVTG